MALDYRIAVLGLTAATLVACGGGGGGGGGGGTVTPPPALLTSFSSALPASGSVTARPAVIAASTISGTTTPSPAPAPVAAIAALAAETAFSFNFQTVSLARAGTDGFAVTMTNPGRDGATETVNARFDLWGPLIGLGSGIKVSYDENTTLSGYAAEDYNRPTGAQAEAIGMDGTAAAGLSYSSFAYWLIADVFTDGDGQFIAAMGTSIGTTSPALNTIASLPTTATYTGTTVGAAVAETDSSLLLLAGRIVLTADFRASSLNAVISNITLFDGDSFFAADMPDTLSFTGVSIDNATSSFAGASGGGMTVAANDGVPVADGALAGQFYGSQAQEAGGAWGLTIDPDTADAMRVTGSFGAKR